MTFEYLTILDYSSGASLFIHLTPEEIEESKKYEDYEDFLETLGKKYSFRLKDCYWMLGPKWEWFLYEDGELKGHMEKG